jgi:hypothetical protein
MTHVNEKKNAENFGGETSRKESTWMTYIYMGR